MDEGLLPRMAHDQVVTEKLRLVAAYAYALHLRASDNCYDPDVVHGIVYARLKDAIRNLDEAINAYREAVEIQG